MPVTDQHAVHLYTDDAELARHVARHVTSAAGGIVVAPRPHLRLVLQAIAARGGDPAGLAAQGRLELLDADRLVDRLLVDGRPDARRFAAWIGRRVDRMARHGPVHAHGELVDLLWQRGELVAALELEEMWTRFLKGRRVRLLCGYRMDLHDPDGTAAVEAVCASHGTWVGPAPDTGLRDRFLEVMGRHAQALHHLALSSTHTARGLPEAHRLVFWTSRHLPRRMSFLGTGPAHAPAATRRRRPLVLVIDDESDDALLLRIAALRTRRAPRLHVARDVPAAMRWLAQQTERDHVPDLIVVGLGPTEAAFETIGDLKENAAWGHVPVLAWGGAGRPDDVRRALARGALSHYPKPEGVQGLTRFLAGLSALATAVQEDRAVAAGVRERSMDLDGPHCAAPDAAPAWPAAFRRAVPAPL